MSEDALEIQTDLKSSSPRVLATKVFAKIGAHFGETRSKEFCISNRSQA